MNNDIIIRQETYDAVIGDNSYLPIGTIEETEYLDNTELVKLAYSKGLIQDTTNVDIMTISDTVSLERGEIIDRRFYINPIVIKDIEVNSNGDVSEENLCLEVVHPNNSREYIYGNYNSVDSCIINLVEQKAIDANCTLIINNVSYQPGGCYTKAAVTFLDGNEVETKILK